MKPVSAFIKTTNGGTLWTSQTSGTTGELHSVCFINADTGFTVGESYNINGYYGIILKTINGGATWTTLSSGVNKELYSICFTDANTGYAVGQNGTLLKTTNGGSLWTNQTSGTSEWLCSVHFTDADTGYAVGWNGTILKTSNGGYPFGINNLLSRSISLKIYPNPSSSQVTIETSTVPVNGQLSIMNLNGQEVLSRQITEPKPQLDISGLPSGVYFVRLTSQGMVKVGKIIKQ